jgi:two-component system sensor histidine kinase BaeS
MWLRARVTDDVVAISVQDTGSGMEPDVLAHIFDRYYSGTGPRTRGGRGTGLGLPISWAIARAHSGNLTADSTPGEGSTFTLVLPLNPTEVSTEGMI